MLKSNTLLCNKVPSAGFGVCVLNESGISLCVAGLIEFNLAGYAVKGYRGKNLQNVCRSGGACFLESLKSNKVCVIAHCGNCCNSVVAAVVGLCGAVLIDPLFDAFIKFLVAALLIEGGNIDLCIGTLCSVEDNV